MRAFEAHKGTMILAAMLIASFAFISSCEEEKIVEVPVEVPADCPPSAPRGVYAVNLDGYVQICWYPNPEEDVVGYDVWKNDELYGTYEWIGTVDAEDTDPYEYCFEYDTPNGDQFFYAVSAYNESNLLSDLSYEEVTGTPRPEGFLRLYDEAVHSDSCGYDFSSLSNIAQECTLPSTDIAFDTTGGTDMFIVRMPSVMIQDYGYTYSFDDINFAPELGWSPTGMVEVIESHCYMLRLGEADGQHYVKVWVHTVENGHTDFWWAYQTDPYNRDLLEGQPEGAALTSGSDTGGIKKIEGFPKGRQVPPTSSSGKQDNGSILQKQNTLP